MNDRKQVPNADLHELASLYALEALDAGEKIAFEEHLRQGCEACAKDVRSFTDITNDADRDARLLPTGRLCDIAPTMLAVLGLPQPPDMTGRSLLVRK